MSARPNRVAAPTRPGAPSTGSGSRRLLLSGLLAVLLTGCATGPAGSSRGDAAGRLPADPSPDSPLPAMRLDEQVQGRIVSVNAALRFVVMDFPIRKLPALEQRLNIYRGDQKMGEVRVTGPVRDTTIAGDLLSGQAQVGDLVRED